MMNRIPDFTSLISSPPFTFLVGKDHTKLTIQSGLAKHVSRPLDDLMNNGHTRESKHRIAVLEDEEVEVFTAFTQYAYTGNYTVPVQKTGSSSSSSSSSIESSPALKTAPAPPSVASPRSGSGSSGGGSGPDVRNGHSPTYEQQQPQNINIVRTQSSASSFLPPPAPTPPPFADRLDSRPPVRRYAETPLAVTQTAGVDDQWENPFAHPAEQHPQRNGASRETPPVENRIREVVVIQERPQPQPEEDDQSAFPLSRRHSRKDKKKKRKDTVVPASGFEETVPKSLTPPSTPPFDEKDVQDQTGTPKINKSEVRDYDPDCAIETDTGDDGEIDGEDGDWWNQPVTSQNFSRRQDYEDKLSNARRLQSQNQQQQQQQQAPSPPRLSPQQHTMPFIDTSFASHPMSSTPRKKGAKSWNEFASMDYFHQERSEGSGVTTPTPALHTIIAPYILFHAKVYVFAMRYLIPGLAQLCLQKLHTSLLDYPLDPPTDNEDEVNSQHALNSTPQQDTETLKFNAHAKMFLDILKYTYENTTRFEPESQTSATLLRECELRKLVAQYAACKMRELAVYTPAPIPVPSSPSHGPGSGVSVISAPGGGLRELLDKIPELASDLVFLMMM